jgi:hypothetical protein
MYVKEEEGRRRSEERGGMEKVKSVLLLNKDQAIPEDGGHNVC